MSGANRSVRGSMVLSADNYSKPKAREYQELMDIVEGRGDHKNDGTYGRLMDKERRVLDTVDRVVNDARLQKIASKSILNMPVVDIVGRAGTSVSAIYQDILRIREPHDVITAFTKDDRRLYVGIIIVVISVIVLFFQAIH